MHPRTHDYRRRGRGHDYTFSPVAGGLKGSMFGWGAGIKAGDYLILPNGKGETRYRVAEVNYFTDPPDQWSASVVFDPRGEAS